MDYTKYNRSHIHGLHTEKQITYPLITHKMKQITSMDYTQMKLITYGRITHKIKQITYIHRSLAE